MIRVARRAVAAGVLAARALGARVPSRADVVRERAEVGGVPGRLWRPARGGGAPVLLALGVTPRGADDPRVVRVADAVARAGHVAFVPRLLLADQRLTEEDVERLVVAIRALGEADSRPRTVTAVGFSFGGSYSLLAAVDPRVRPHLRAVAAFGAYGQLGGVAQAVTTGVTLLDGRQVPWPAGAERFGAGTDAILRGHFATILAARLDVDADGGGRQLRAAFAGQTPPDRLDAPARAAYDLLTNRDPARTARLIARLPPPLPDVLERLSPVNVADRLDCPVVLLHAVDDPTVPYAELLRLRRALPTAEAHAVRYFTHMDFKPSPRQVVAAARDVTRVWRFASVVLGRRPDATQSAS